MRNFLIAAALLLGVSTAHADEVINLSCDGTAFVYKSAVETPLRIGLVANLAQRTIDGIGEHGVLTTTDGVEIVFHSSLGEGMLSRPLFFFGSINRVSGYLEVLRVSNGKNDEIWQLTCVPTKQLF